MGVYMPNMKMPKSCWDCPLDTLVCDLWRSLRASAYEEMAQKRRDDCPLVEVHVPHGRLIDADSAIKKHDNVPIIGEHAKLILNRCETIIEREEE